MQLQNITVIRYSLLKLYFYEKINKIPASFSLSKYDEVAQFDAAQWFVNLEKRYLLLEQSTLFDESYKFFKNRIKKDIMSLLENPIVTIEKCDGTSLLGIQDDAVMSLKNKDFFELLLYTDLFYEEKDFQNLIDLIGNVSSPMTMIGPTNSKSSEKYFWNADISPRGMAFAKINLLASDETLVNDFKVWVRREKEKRTIHFVNNKATKLSEKIHKHAPTQADFNQWHSNKILPYLDLIIWAKENQVKLTHDQLGEVLFANSGVDDSTLKITRSTKPKADELMNRNILMIFASQVKKSIKPEPEPVCIKDYLEQLKDSVAAASKQS